MHLSTVFRAIRPSFIILTPVCVFLGFSLSLKQGIAIDYFIFSLVLIAATFSHISVNTLNEYFDFKSGLDLKTEKTKFSGGSGALPENPEAGVLVLTVGLLSLALTIIIGLFLIENAGLKILPIGIAGIVLIITYTHWLNRFPLLCLFAPGLGFGVLMVAGTYVMLAGEYAQLAWFISLPPLFLINNLLLLNQYPDMKADASVGRRTFPIAFGIKTSNVVYGVFALAAYSLILVYIINDLIPLLSVIALVPAVLSIYAFFGVIKYNSKISDYPQYIGANVGAAILAPMLLAISMVFGY